MDWFVLGFLAGVGLAWGLQGLKYLQKPEHLAVFSERDHELEQLRRMAGLSVEKK